MSRTTSTLFLGLALGAGSVVHASTTQVFLKIQPEDERYEQDKSKERVFAGASIKVGDGAWTSAKELKTKGQSCIHAFRKCFSVELEGHVPFLDAEGQRLSLSHFDLLSMGEDLGLTSVDLGRQYFAAVGVFPLEGGYAELLVNGRSKGLYYLLESPRHFLVRRQGAVFASRGSGLRNKFKTKFYEKDEAPYAQEQYVAAREEILTRAKRLEGKGEELYDALVPRMDIDTYLRYQILNYLLMNGDFADEVFWYAKSGKQGDPIYFHIMAWDLESLFEKPHWFPQNTIVWRGRIKHSFFYGMESKLDRRLSNDDAIQQRMARMAHEMLTSTFTPAFIAKTTEATRQRLLPYAEESRVLAPSIHDSGRAAPYTKAELLQLLEWKETLLLARRVELLKKAAGIMDTDAYSAVPSPRYPAPSSTRPHSRHRSPA